MEWRKVLALFALVAVFAGGAVCAASTSTSGDAVLQITDYSTVPETVYPGTSGYAKFTVSNTGSDTATGITVYYSYYQSSTPLSQITAGDISAGSSSQLTIPFKVPSEVPSGMYAINVDVYYFSSGSSNSKKTSVSIPIATSQYEALEVTTLSGGTNALAPGETLRLNVEVKNKGGVVNNLVVSAPQNSSFSLEGTTAKSLGSIPSGDSVNVTLGVTSSSTADVGQYTIPLVFTYQDALGTTTTQTLYLGPVSILEPSTQFKLSMNPLTPTEVGSQAVFQITLENTGTSALNAIVDINSTDEFTPIGVSRVYLDPIGPGQSVSQNVTLGISSSVTAGYYVLPLEITLGSGKATTQSVGIPVTATPSITISADTQSDGKVQIQISNTGNAAIRSVYVSVEPDGFTVSGQTDKFIGTLNIDDFATFTLSLGASGSPGAGARTLPVTVTFKDSNNEFHTVKKSVELQASSANATGTAAFTPPNGSMRGSQGVIFGLGWLQIGAVLVIAAAAYFAYRHFRKKAVKKGGAAA